MTSDHAAPPARKTYRHGDLRRTLLAAGVALASEIGPEAVTLREATRRAGVVPNAAYRHFANHAAFLDAIRRAALTAMAQTMLKRIRALGPERPDVDYARARLRAVGSGYLRFARQKTGLFRTAFVVQFELPPKPETPPTVDTELNPFQLLSAALDGLVRCGALPLVRRSNAEYLAWSAVHGMAMLAIDGPLRRLSAKQFDALGERLLEMVEQGISRG
jgi:AcrR family transcriptional regulator